MERVAIGFNSFKSKVDKLDVNKLVPAPVDLSKLSDIVKYDVAKKIKFNELVEKVKINENEKKKITDHDQSNKYNTTQEFN